jgi:predicted MFS family arabinose efflux permease
MTTLVSIVTIQMLVIGIIAFFTQAWFTKQRDPLFARYRIATIFLWLMAFSAAALLIYHFTIHSHSHTLDIIPMWAFILVFAVQRRIARQLKNRGQ